MFVSVIIAAAGAGRRLGADKPKQLLDIGGGSMLRHSVQAFLDHPRVSEIVVVKPAGPLSLDVLGGDPLSERPGKLHVVDGGDRRQDSVANGLDAVSPLADVILIHDAARPFVSAALIDRTIDAAAAHGAAIAALPSRDTVKQVRDGIIVDTIPRETIYLAQTPQGFRRDVLAAAVKAGRDSVEATDEAALAERAGYQVHVVDGDPGNVKITTAEDLERARQRMASATSADSAAERSASSAANSAADRSAASAAERSVASAAAARIGTGYDLHVLAAGRPLIVGGVTIPFDKGPLGHSDGDVACHAATDAILGAASLGDIGRHFPDSDPQWKGADSLVLLREAARMVADAGYSLVNLDITVILERPRIKDFIDGMRIRLAGAAGIDPGSVSIKGKTNEGVDAVGRGEAIAAHAVALLRSNS